ncbi:MAG: efflux RND transporter periplasmic adaptor subunit [Phycisphaerae bacterium]
MGESPILRSLVLISVLLGGGSGVAALLYATRAQLPRRHVTAGPPVVDAVLVSREDVTEWLVGYGSAVSNHTASLTAEVAATVVERVNNIETGSVAVAGQPLVRLDAREYRRSLERVQALAEADQASIDELSAEARALEELRKTAEHELAVAAAERRRVADLYERHLAATKEFDFANLAYQQARRILQGYEMELAKLGPRRARLEASKRSREAEAALAALNVERCVVAAPFSGSIDALFVDQGDHVAPGSPVLTLIDPSDLEVAVQLPASVYDRVEAGAPCILDCESMPATSWKGQVARKAPSVDEQTRTFSVYVEVDNSKQRSPLVPGTFVRARVRGHDVEKSILVPRGAVRDGRVLVAADGVARARSVSIVHVIGDRAVVRGDIREGDHVIVSHLGQLEDGSPVRLHASQPAPSSPAAPPDKRAGASQ